MAGSRFVGNSFLLFEPVFSLARRLYISAPPSLFLSFSVYARTNIRGARSIVAIIFRYISFSYSFGLNENRLFLVSCFEPSNPFFFFWRRVEEELRNIESSCGPSPCKHLRFNVLKSLNSKMKKSLHTRLKPGVLREEGWRRRRKKIVNTHGPFRHIFFTLFRPSKETSSFIPRNKQTGWK